MYAPIRGITPGTIIGAGAVAIGPSLLLRALVVSLIARLRSLPMCLVGGLAVGVAESIVIASNGGDRTIVELTERLRYQAAHDGLTELCNRREFERRLQEALELRQGRTDASSFALLYIDLDQFKLINDVSGHMAGDQLLVQLVHAMRARLRPGDLRAIGRDRHDIDDRSMTDELATRRKREPHRDYERQRQSARNRGPVFTIQHAASCFAGGNRPAPADPGPGGNRV